MTVRNSIKTAFSIVVFLAFIFLYGTFAVYASDAGVKVSSVTALEGEKVSVNVTVTTTDKPIGGFQLYLKYDEGILEYQSGAEAAAAGKLTLFYVMQQTADVMEVTKTITFIAKKPGISELEIDAQSEILDANELAPFNVVASAGKATVTAPVAKSGNCNIKNMTVYAVDNNGESKKVSLTPSFGADKTEYSLDVDYDISKLSIKATAEDGKATIKIGGISLKEGDNITTITVTAENGNTKKYFIYTNKAKAPKETDATPAPTTGEPANDSYTEIIVGESKMYVPISLSQVAVPEGFEEQKCTYNGVEIAAARGLSKNLTIVYMLDENLENGKFYIYDETNLEFYAMTNIQTSGKMYTIVKKPGDVNVPEGYVQVRVQIEGQEVTAWAAGEKSDFYYVYAMNYNGESGMYCYDEHEKTMQRVSIYSDAFSKDEEYESMRNENKALAISQKELSLENQKLKKTNKNIKVGGIITIAAIVIGGVIVVVMRLSGAKKTDAGQISNDEPDEQDEMIDRLLNIDVDDDFDREE